MRNKIEEAARSYLGVRWVHQGRNRFGIDCAGLIICVAHELELSEFEITAYPRRTAGKQFAHHFLEAGLVEIDKDDLQAGDIVLTHTKDHPCHCGFITEKKGQKFFVHAFVKRGEVVEDRFEGFWDRKTYMCLRFPQLVE